MKTTDQNSVYRQVFNRDLSFFLYVIDQVDLPILIKLHIVWNDHLASEYQNSQLINNDDIIESVKQEIDRLDIGYCDYKIEVKIF